MRKKEIVIPQTVPKRPMKRETPPVVADVGEVLAAAEGVEELIGLLEGRLDRLALEKNDGPGEHREENEDQEDELDDDIGFGDDSENVDIHGYPSKK